MRRYAFSATPTAEAQAAGPVSGMVWPILISRSVTPGAFSAAAPTSPLRRSAASIPRHPAPALVESPAASAPHYHRGSVFFHPLKSALHSKTRGAEIVGKRLNACKGGVREVRRPLGRPELT